MAQSPRKAPPLPSPNTVILRRELQYATTQGMNYIQSMAVPLLLCAVIASLPISGCNLNCSLICKVGIIRRPVSPGCATGWYWNIAQTEGKSLSLISARSGWCFCWRPGASAIMPLPRLPGVLTKVIHFCLPSFIQFWRVCSSHLSRSLWILITIFQSANNSAQIRVCFPSSLALMDARSQWPWKGPSSNSVVHRALHWSVSSITVLGPADHRSHST